MLKASSNEQVGLGLVDMATIIIDSVTGFREKSALSVKDISIFRQTLQLPPSG